MSTDLRAALADLAESAAPELEALPAARRAALARDRARGIRRRRTAGRSLAVAAVAAVAVGALRLAPTGGLQPAEPPFKGVDRLSSTIEGRDLMGSVPVEVDGDPVRVTVTPPDTDLEVRFFCSRRTDVELRVSVDGGRPAVIAGCDDTIQSTSRAVEKWSDLGVTARRATTFTLSATSTRPPTTAELESPTWAFVGLYGGPASALPARPAPVPGTAGLRRVATVTLDADHWALPVVLPRPPSGKLYVATSCAGPADGLLWMVHTADNSRMIATGRCWPAEPPTRVDPLPAIPGTRDVSVRVFAPTNYGQDIAVRVPQPGARVVVSFYERAAG